MSETLKRSGRIVGGPDVHYGKAADLPAHIPGGSGPNLPWPLTLLERCLIYFRAFRSRANLAFSCRAFRAIRRLPFIGPP